MGMDKGVGLRHRHTQDHQESWFLTLGFPGPAWKFSLSTVGLGWDLHFFF